MRSKARAPEAAGTSKKSRSAARAKTRPAPIAEPAPRQGYDAESDLGLGFSVSPPSASELLGSLAELAGDLAQSGLIAGGRLLKGALSRLSGS
ncbi:MAG: hypothetical protein ACYCSI_00495 [Solirubrobacteraceae bacterium]